jgi:hypothetical protein
MASYQMGLTPLSLRKDSGKSGEKKKCWKQEKLGGGAK